MNSNLTRQLLSNLIESISHRSIPEDNRVTIITSFTNILYYWDFTYERNFLLLSNEFTREFNSARWKGLVI